MREEKTISLYNTESKKKEKIYPQTKDASLLMYTCGPTVYDYAHIGNFRTYIAEDLLRRTLEYFGFQVTQVMNITDIDDKTIKGAIEKNLPLEEYTKIFTQAFFEDIDALKIQKAHLYPKATDHIKEMIHMIEHLLEKGVAYKSEDGSIYYRIDQFPSYGRLSHLHLHELEVGASSRVAADEYNKEAVADFVLWKAYDPSRDQNIFWESPFGKGRPGWHLECSAMALKHLGTTIDIHAGGVDNIFPHHENEIAQSEAYSEEHFVRFWFHVEHLIVEGKKMSKSLGNFYTFRDLIHQGFTPEEVRYLLLHTHYKTPLNFTLEGLYGARNTLKRCRDFVMRMQNLQLEKKKGYIDPILARTKELFEDALADDLNISAALAALFDLIRDINILIDQEKVSKEDGKEVVNLLKECNQVLGVLPLEIEEKIPQEILEAFHKRQEARKQKNWEEADKWRDFIHEKGFKIEDAPSGSIVKKQ